VAATGWVEDGATERAALQHPLSELDSRLVTDAEREPDAHLRFAPLMHEPRTRGRVPATGG